MRHLLAASLLLTACQTGDNETPDAGAAPVADVGQAEAGNSAPDAGPEDAGMIVDAGPVVVDAGPPPDTPEGRGEALYTIYCGFCHGDSGEGYIADNANALSHPEFLATADDAFLFGSIVEGRPGTPMSAWGEARNGPLSDEQAWDIVAYMRTWQEVPSQDVSGRVITGDLNNGGMLYTAHGCGDCHGAMLQGVTAMSLNNPWFHELASDGFIEHAIAKGRVPTPMPAYEDILSEQEIADLVVYIRSFRRPVDVDPEDPGPFEPNLADHWINEGGPRASFTPRVVEREGAEFPDEFVAAADVYAAMEAGQSFILVDARAASDYILSHIEGAVSVPFDTIEAAQEALSRDTWVVTYCGCPHAVSGRARRELKRAGFERVAVLDEGYYFWSDENYPICEGRERFCAEP